MQPSEWIACSCGLATGNVDAHRCKQLHGRWWASRLTVLRLLHLVLRFGVVLV